MIMQSEKRYDFYFAFLSLLFISHKFTKTNYELLNYITFVFLLRCVKTCCNCLVPT